MANEWILDKAHTSVTFSVRHMVISKVKGSFSEVEGTLKGTPDDFSNAQIDVAIDVSSIHTNQKDRDDHLRSEDFFNSSIYPQMTFHSTSIVQTSDHHYDITGDMTIKGNTKQVTFTAEYDGHGKNPWGVDVIAYEVKGSIKREDFGLTWNQALETGGVLVGSDIQIALDVQLNPKQ